MSLSTKPSELHIVLQPDLMILTIADMQWDWYDCMNYMIRSPLTD